MIGLTVGLRAESHDRQNRGDRPPSRGEDGASEEDFDVLPNRFGKDRRKDRDDAKELGRQCEHSYPFVVEA
jgi:hypothetical protein